MTNKWRSSEVFAGAPNAGARALWKSMGYCDGDFAERPVIGIANSWNTLVPGHFNLNQVAEQVKKGIHRAGGVAAEFGVIASCDGVCEGHRGMHFILPQREVIADSVELVVEAHHLDAIVLLASCDKIVPGMLMAAARLDIPAIMITGGPMLGGVEFDGRKTDETSLHEALGMLTAGRISEEEFRSLENLCAPTCGSCSFFGTANTMCCLAEVLGMTLPGSALAPAVHAERLRLACATGERICEMAREGLTARKILNAPSIVNGVRATLAMSGSTNAVMHLAAIAAEAEAGVDVMELFSRLGPETPQIVRVNPASKWNTEDFWMAGGIPRMLKNMLPIIEKDALTCTGRTVEENVKAFRFPFPKNDEVMKTLESPFSKRGGIAVLRGNLAPDTGVTKPGAIDPTLHVFTGEARVFDSEDDANAAILAGKIHKGDVVVIRYEGPKGGPGMREMYRAMKYLYGMGLNKCTALVTDGRFSGTNNGCFVGHVSPEAAEGGPIAIVRDGDRITIDVIEGKLHLHVDADEIRERFESWTKPAPKVTRGHLALYSKLASSAAKGAIVSAE